MPISILPDDMASFTDVEHYSRGGAGHSLDTLTRHEGYLSEIYSQGADDIMSAAKTSSQEEVLGAIKRTGQKWEDELVRTVADARGGGVLAKAQYLNAHVRSNARAAQVEVLRKECERLRKLHARAIELGRSQLERTFQKWMGASLANSFHGWREAAKAGAKAAKEQEMARQLEVLKRELETQREELQAAHAAEVSRLKRELWDVGGTQREIDRLREAAIKSAVNRMRMAAAAASFETWTEWWRATRRAKYVLRKIVMSRVARAMEAWKTLVMDKQRLRTKMRQVAGRILNRRLANSWDQWVSITREVAENQLKVKRMLLKMKNKELNGSFTRWYDAVNEVQEQRARLKRIISRARHQGMAPAWDRWIDNMRELQRMRDLLQRVMSRARNRGMSAGFQRWCEAVQEVKSLRTRATRAMSKFRNRNLSQAYSRWSEHTKEAKGQRGKLERAFKKMANRNLAGAFTRWSDFWKEKRKMRVLMERAAHRFKNVPQARAFTRWREFLEEKNWVLNRVDQITRRMKHRVKAAPFERWVEMVFESQELRAKLVQALQRLKNGMMAKTWSAWIDAVDETTAKREAAEAVMNRLKQRALVGAYNRWREFTDETVQMRERLLSVMSRMQNAKLARIWNSWVDFIKARRRLMARLELTMKRFVQRRMYTAFKTWHTNVVKGAEARAEAERQAKLSATEREREKIEEEKRAADFKVKLNAKRSVGMERILRRIMTRVCGAALDAWWAVVVDGREKKALCGAILYRVQNRQIAITFDAWMHAVNNLQRQRHVIARALNRLHKVTRGRVLTSWAGIARRDRVEALTRRAEDAERVLGIRTRHNMAVCVPLLRQLTSLDLDSSLGHEVFALFDFLVPKSVTSKRSGKPALSKEAMELAGENSDLLDIAAKGRSAAETFENPQQSEKRFRGEQRVVEIVNSQLAAMQLRLEEVEDQNRNLRIERETAITRVKEEMEKKHKFDVAALRRLNAQETRTANERARATRVQASVDDRMLVAANNTTSSSLSSYNRPTPGMMPPTTGTRRAAAAAGVGGGVLSPRSAAASPIKMANAYNIRGERGERRPQSASGGAAAADASPSFMAEGTSATKKPSTAYKLTTFQPPGSSGGGGGGGSVRTRMAFE